MKMKNCVYIGTSLDGYIADEHGGLEWLDVIPIPEGTDMGYDQFMERIDALVMGRTTFETVCGFDVDWPYTKPVFVLSRTLDRIPESHEGKAHLVNGTLNEVLDQIHGQGYYRLYIDGGKTIQSFLEEDLINELIITTIPILLGGGTPLFSKLSKRLSFRCTSSKVLLDAIVQSHFVRYDPS
jgi:dihydrofolate reductase